MEFETFEGTIDDFMHRHRVIVPIHIEDKDNHVHDSFLSSFLLKTDGYDVSFKDYIYKLDHPECFSNSDVGRYSSKIYEVRDSFYGPFFRTIAFIPVDVNSIVLGNNLYYLLDVLGKDMNLPIGLVKFDYEGRPWNDILNYCLHNFQHKIDKIVTYDPIYSEMKNIVNEIKNKELSDTLKEYFFEVDGDEIDYDILD